MMNPSEKTFFPFAQIFKQQDTFTANQNRCRIAEYCARPFQHEIRLRHCCPYKPSLVAFACENTVNGSHSRNDNSPEGIIYGRINHIYNQHQSAHAFFHQWDQQRCLKRRKNCQYPPRFVRHDFICAQLHCFQCCDHKKRSLG